MPKTTQPFDPGEYTLVAERIRCFYERFPEGRITTDLIARDERSVTFRASIYRSPHDELPAATGWASEREGDGEINTVACLENAETSAVGRALANLGFSASRPRPSAEDTTRTERERPRIPMAVATTSRTLSRAPSRTVTQPSPDRPTHAARSTRDRETHVASPSAEFLDALDLLDRAERAGMPADQAGSLRAQLGSGSPSARELAHLETGLRDWLLRRHEAPRWSEGGTRPLRESTSEPGPGPA